MYPKYGQKSSGRRSGQTETSKLEQLMERKRAPDHAPTLAASICRGARADTVVPAAKGADTAEPLLTAQFAILVFLLCRGADAIV